MKTNQLSVQKLAQVKGEIEGLLSSESPLSGADITRLRMLKSAKLTIESGLLIPNVLKKQKELILLKIHKLKQHKTVKKLDPHKFFDGDGSLLGKQSDLNSQLKMINFLLQPVQVISV